MALNFGADAFITKPFDPHLEGNRGEIAQLTVGLVHPQSLNLPHSHSASAMSMIKKVDRTAAVITPFHLCVPSGYCILVRMCD
jgi:hypothetical protein